MGWQRRVGVVPTITRVTCGWRGFRAVSEFAKNETDYWFPTM